jgi:rod shape-determining protein MreD
LVLVLVCGWSLLRGQKEGSLWALMSGILIDLLSGATFGLGTVSLLVASLLSGWRQFRQFQSALLLPIAVIGIAALVHDLVFLIGLSLTGWSVPWAQTWLSVVLPGALLTAALTLLVYPPLRRLGARFSPAESAAAADLTGVQR